MGYWLRTGEFESDILIDKDFNLVDGYSSLKIAHYSMAAPDTVPFELYIKAGTAEA